MSDPDFWCKAAQGPDEFLSHQWEQADPDRLIAILRRWTDQLQRHPDTLEEVLEERLVTTVPEFSRGGKDRIWVVNLTGATRRCP